MLRLIILSKVLRPLFAAAKVSVLVATGVPVKAQNGAGLAVASNRSTVTLPVYPVATSPLDCNATTSNLKSVAVNLVNNGLRSEGVVFKLL